MKYRQGIQTIILLVTCLTLLACASTAAHYSKQSVVGANWSAQQPLVQIVTDNTQRIIGKIDWHHRRIYSRGYGKVGTQPRNVTQARLSSKQAALDDAYSTMLETIKFIQVDANDTTALYYRHSAVYQRISGMINHAEIVQVNQHHNGNYDVILSLPLSGKEGVIAALIPTRLAKVRTQNHNKGYDWQVNIPQYVLPSDYYSSVIIDARGLAYIPAAFPTIRDSHGNIIYALDTVDPNAALFMLCDYVDSMERAKQNPRAGANPLLIKAQRTGAKNSVDLHIAQRDADKLVAADSRGHFLSRARVIVVIDD